MSFVSSEKHTYCFAKRLMKSGSVLSDNFTDNTFNIKITTVGADFARHNRVVTLTMLLQVQYFLSSRDTLTSLS